ncbi:MAG: hypothetical protein M1818_001995 [Claussenomyces sp. TS43310]|nr:MAG: hypothetical protein M1818_001995 [Claussenomyces sp. TS43310]
MDVPRLLAERRSTLVEKYRRERDAAAVAAAIISAEKWPDTSSEQQQAATPVPTTISYSALKPARKRHKTSGRSNLSPSTKSYLQLTIDQEEAPALERQQRPSPDTLFVDASGSTDSTLHASDGNKEDRNGPIHVFGPAPKPSRKGQKAEYQKQEIVESRVPGYPSAWYASISTRKEPPRGHVIAMGYIKNLIQNCVTAVRSDNNPNLCLSNLRTKLHEIEFFSWLTDDSGPVIKKSGVLEKGGLMTIFDDPNDVFPWDLKADALALYRRWMRADLDGHLLRGIDTVKGTLSSGLNRTSHKIQKNYSKRRSPNVSGSNDLVNGQWWPNRMCVLRDGAHGEQEAGIHGQTGQGAYSVVIAAGGYADEDDGVVSTPVAQLPEHPLTGLKSIEYCGTASKTPTPTKNTALLSETLQLQKPVRVLRAENRASKYAPRRGIRYDGLYDVVDEELLDASTAMYRFSLRRRKNQDPIRYEGVEARPTDQEVAEMMKIRDYLGMT